MTVNITRVSLTLKQKRVSSLSTGWLTGCELLSGATVSTDTYLGSEKTRYIMVQHVHSEDNY